MYLPVGCRVYVFNAELHRVLTPFDIKYGMTIVAMNEDATVTLQGDETELDVGGGCIARTICVPTDQITPFFADDFVAEQEAFCASVVRFANAMPVRNEVFEMHAEAFRGTTAFRQTSVHEWRVRGRVAVTPTPCGQYLHVSTADGTDIILKSLGPRPDAKGTRCISPKKATSFPCGLPETLSVPHPSLSGGCYVFEGKGEPVNLRLLAFFTQTAIGARSFARTVRSIAHMRQASAHDISYNVYIGYCAEALTGRRLFSCTRHAEILVPFLQSGACEKALSLTKVVAVNTTPNALVHTIDTHRNALTDDRWTCPIIRVLRGWVAICITVLDGAHRVYEDITNAPAWATLPGVKEMMDLEANAAFMASIDVTGKRQVTSCIAIWDVLRALFANYEDLFVVWHAKGIEFSIGDARLLLICPNADARVAFDVMHHGIVADGRAIVLDAREIVLDKLFCEAGIGGAGEGILGAVPATRTGGGAANDAPCNTTDHPPLKDDEEKKRRRKQKKKASKSVAAQGPVDDPTAKDDDTATKERVEAVADVESATRPEAVAKDGQVASSSAPATRSKGGGLLGAHVNVDTAQRAFSVLESTIHYYMSTLKDRFHKRAGVGDVQHILSQVTVANLVFVLTGAKEPTTNHLSLVLDGSTLVEVDGQDVRLVEGDNK
tara:strand:- start:680 stop:2671 length:1992 start_codon:yes stop_codon:yes gene_type:complete